MEPQYKKKLFDDDISIGYYETLIHSLHDQNWLLISIITKTILRDWDKYHRVLTHVSYFRQTFLEYMYNVFFKLSKTHNPYIRIPKGDPLQLLLKPISHLIIKEYSNTAFFKKFFKLIYDNPIIFSEIIIEIAANSNNIIDETKIAEVSLWDDDFRFFSNHDVSNRFNHLKVMYIIDQKLTEVPGWLRNYGDIQSLNLYKNRIQSLPSDFNQWFPNLLQLIITDNHFTEFPQVLRKFELLETVNSDFNYSEVVFAPGYGNVRHTLTNILGMIKSEKRITEFLDHVIKDIYIKKYNGEMYKIASYLFKYNDNFKKDIATYIFDLLIPSDFNHEFIMNDGKRSIHFNRPFKLIDSYMLLPEEIREKEDPDKYIYELLKSNTTDYNSSSPVSLAESRKGTVYKRSVKSKSPSYEIIIFMHGLLLSNNKEIIYAPFRHIKHVACKGNVLVTMTQNEPFSALICDNKIDKIMDDRHEGATFFSETTTLMVDINSASDIKADRGIFLCTKNKNGGKNKLEKIMDPFQPEYVPPAGFTWNGTKLFGTLGNAVPYILDILKNRNINPNQCDLIIAVCRGFDTDRIQSLQYAHPRRQTRTRTKTARKTRKKYGSTSK